MTNSGNPTKAEDTSNRMGNARFKRKSMKAWVDNLKVRPWTVLTFTEKTLKYLDVDGKRVTEPFKFLIGIG
jgi:hypothetical protein